MTSIIAIPIFAFLQILKERSTLKEASQSRHVLICTGWHWWSRTCVGLTCILIFQCLLDSAGANGDLAELGHCTGWVAGQDVIFLSLGRFQMSGLLKTERPLKFQRLITSATSTIVKCPCGCGCDLDSNWTAHSKPISNLQQSFRMDEENGGIEKSWQGEEQWGLRIATKCISSCRWSSVMPPVERRPVDSDLSIYVLGHKLCDRILPYALYYTRVR